MTGSMMGWFQDIPRRDVAYTDKVLALSPVAYWILNESSGADVADATGNTPDGTASGVTWGVDGIGDGNTAAGFDGINDSIDVISAELAAVFDADEGAISFWVWHDSAGAAAYRGPFEINQDADNSFAMYGRPNTNMVSLARLGGTQNSTAIPSAIPQDRWVHQVIVWSKTADFLRNYQGGTLMGTPDTSYDGTFSGPIDTATLGLGGSFYLDGRQAHVALFDFPLTPEQVASLAEVC